MRINLQSVLCVRECMCAYIHAVAPMGSLMLLLVKLPINSLTSLLECDRLSKFLLLFFWVPHQMDKWYESKHVGNVLSGMAG